MAVSPPLPPQQSAVADSGERGDRDLLGLLPRSLRLGQVMAVMVLLAACPLIGLAAYTTTLLLQNQRQTVIDGLTSNARSLAAAVEAEMGRYVAIAETLTHSATLRSGDTSTFRSIATEALIRTPGSRVIVADAAGQQIVHTGLPAGADLSKRTNLDLHKVVIETGRTQISDIRTGRSGHPSIDIEAPVVVDGRPAYVLVLALDLGTFGDLLRTSQAAAGRLSGVLDRQHRFIARFPDNEKRVGTLAAPDWRREIAARPESIHEGTSLEGASYINAYVTTSQGWTVGVGIDKAVIDRDLYRTIWILGTVGALCTGIAVLLSLLVARRVVGSARALTGETPRTKGAKADGGPLSGIVEFDEIAARLVTQRDAALREIRQRQRIESALRESEARFRNMADHAPVMVWLSDEQGRCVYQSESWREFTGLDVDPRSGFAWLGAVHPDDRERAKESFVAASARHEPIQREYRLRRKDGEWRWVLDAAMPRFDGEGRFFGYIGSILDMHDRRQAEEQVRYLMREVNHRAKNMLAVIQAVAVQSARASPDEFVPRFTARLRALAMSHDLVVKSEWSAVSLEQLIRSQLMTFVGLNRIALEGPPLELRATAAQSLGMAVHELATNAAKYGALSVDHGTVEVAWGLADGGTMFWMSWTENGGPPVEQPRHKGFGSTVLTDMTTFAFAGTVTIDYRPTGLAWRLECMSINIVGNVHAAPALGA